MPDNHTHINYKEIIKNNPWIVSKNKSCVLSPDVDGLLCGLIMSSFLDWNIVGYYDGKNLTIENNIDPKNVIYLDMEILRKNVLSIGHHMNSHDIGHAPDGFNLVMNNCVNPNYIRKFDRSHSFARKYPLGTVHLLMYILENQYPGMIKINKEGLASLFFADGVWKILFKYTSNVLDWFDYLHSESEADWWSKLKTLSVIELIEEIEHLLIEFKKLNATGKNWYGHFDPEEYSAEKNKIDELIVYFSDKTGWMYKKKNWEIHNPKHFSFIKKIYGQNNSGSKSNQKFAEIWNENPLSLAMTDGSTIQYTVDPENIFT